jgi:hypothetical protein
MEEKMQRKTIVSSNIRSIGYNIEKQVLEVEFNGGAVYYYLEVVPIEVVKLVFAESVGSHFAANIKNKYKCVKGEYNV